ncbi:hypothetical protein WN51_03076 [Melipona quadrifasciata]|uniref:Uncharacterized protein n=1 Tax=Melipona quadrifasciata TaxID=166423 RepID=A0A0N0U4T1_9HYME|nr:hypothetical protein WN51_03076 [Melipona quadrifasciata]
MALLPVPWWNEGSSQARDRGWVDSRNKLLNKRKKEGGKREAKSEKRVVVDSCAPVRLPTIKKTWHRISNVAYTSLDISQKRTTLVRRRVGIGWFKKREADHHLAGPCPLTGLVKSQNNTVGESGACTYRGTNLSDGVNRTV